MMYYILFYVVEKYVTKAPELTDATDDCDVQDRNAKRTFDARCRKQESFTYP